MEQKKQMKRAEPKKQVYQNPNTKIVDLYRNRLNVAYLCGAVCTVCAFFGGILVGMSSNDDTRPHVVAKSKGDIYLMDDVQSSATSDIIMAVGVHALKDGLYDSYELRDIVKDIRP